MQILIIDDEPNIRKMTAIALEALGHQSAQAADRAEAMKKVETETFDVAFLDLKLGEEEGLKLLVELRESDPQLQIVVFTAFASLKTVVEAIKKGACDYIAKPITPEQLHQVLKKVEHIRRLEGRVRGLKSQLSAESPLIDFQTREPSVQRIYDMASKVAPTPATLLLLGESGTGKSMIARAIHEQSDRKENPFVTIHCPSLSKDLLESDLFGHVKGAFTGAVGDAIGKVSVAEGGTLFIDEIGELPLQLQPKLLRLLQDREYERVGDHKLRRANVRIIAATNIDLNEAVKEGKFREDLFYRLNVLSLTMPPLRDRMSDLPFLVERALAFFSSQMRTKVKRCSPEAMQALQNYDWPGNLRELRNALERGVILAPGEEIELTDLPDYLNNHREHPKSSEIALGAFISLEQLGDIHIRHVMNKTRSLEQAASVLGIDTATLYRRRKKMMTEPNLEAN